MLETLEKSYNVLKASDYKYRKMVSERLIHKLRHISRVCCERTKLTINLERHTNIEKVLRHKIVEGMQNISTQSYVDIRCYKSIQRKSSPFIQLFTTHFFFLLISLPGDAL